MRSIGWFCHRFWSCCRWHHRCKFCLGFAIHIKTDTTSAKGTSATSNTPATPIPDKTRYLHYDIAKVLGGDGGVVTTSCLYFLVTASIRTVGEGCGEGFTYDALDRLTQSSTTGRINNDVDYSYKVDYKYDINGNILNNEWQSVFHRHR
jgi:hypothetical protein